MSMSRDRVEFKLPYYNNYSASCKKKNEGLIAATHEVLGLTPGQMEDAMRENQTIRCRPSQFARFMILRNDAGLTNGFKELQPRLVPEIKEALDVSQRAFNPEPQE